MPWKPNVPGEIPTLGYIVVDWISEYLAAPDCSDYQPFIPYVEQEDFILRWYALHPNGRRRFHRGVFGRPRGHGKSPLLAALACCEALAPVYFDGWDANGQPVGKPWSEIKTPWVQIAAVSDDQTRNTWQPVLEMLGPDAPVHDEYRIDPMETFVSLPNRGRIEAITSSARTVKGARAHFGVLDQTEEWVPSNGGPHLARTMRTNAAKVGGTTLESPNAYTPGEDSVAEASAEYWDDIKRGRAKNDGLYYDHRESPADTNLDDYDSLIAGLRVSYGDSSGHPDGCVLHDPPCEPGHVDLDRLVATIWDTTQEEADSRTDFLNQITQAADAWVTYPQVAACYNPDAILHPKDEIVLGFDGSRGRGKGKADATALIAVRVADGFTWECGIWEPGLKEKDWKPPHIEIDQCVADWFERARVIGFYADPSGWQEYISKWEAQYRKRLKVLATAKYPIAIWPRGKTSMVVEAVEHARVAIVTGEMSHDGSPGLVKHLLHARKRETPRGDLIYKSYPMSPDKIDAAYAYIMAWKARTDALSKGYGTRNKQSAGRIIVG
jgi:phage terminase large subunit-like protein